MRERLKIGWNKCDEMDMLIQGVEFLNELNSLDECYYFKVEPEEPIISSSPTRLRNTHHNHSKNSSHINRDQQAESSSSSSSPLACELSVSTPLSASHSSSSLSSSQSNLTDYQTSSTASNCRFIKESFAFTNSYPYILVNIGSGVSILLVKSEKKYKRYRKNLIIQIKIIF